MNLIQTCVLRALCIFTFVISMALVSLAQKPEIKSIEKLSGHMDEVVLIKGAYFGTDNTKIAVTFGAAKGEVVSVTDQIIEVKVPAGTTYQEVSVTNLISGLSGYTEKPFLL